MKAIRKSDGKIIEVEESRSYDDELGYWDSENKEFYCPSDLDFNVNMIVIDREEYDELRKYRRYCSNWAHSIVICPHCGELNPNGYVCSNCGGH